MTKPAIEAVVNALLAPNQPITANGQHKPSMQQLINEMYDAASRGAVLNGVPDVLSLASGDKVLLFRSGVAFKADKDLFGGIGTGVTDGDKTGVQVSVGGSVWIPKDFFQGIVDTTGDITLPFGSKEKGVFWGSATFGTTKEVFFTGDSRATEMDFIYEVTAENVPIVFPANTRAVATDPRFVDNVFTSPDIGLYKVHGVKYGGLWLLDFNGVYSVGDAPPEPPDPGDSWVIGSGIWNDTAVWKNTGIWKDNP